MAMRNRNSRPAPPKAGSRARSRPKPSVNRRSGRPGVEQATPTSATEEEQTVSNPAGYTSTPQREFRSLIASQTSATSGQPKGSRSSLQTKMSSLAVEVYSKRFLPPFRANIKMVASLRDNFSYPWREGAGQGYNYTGPEMVDIKLRCDLDLRRHFLTFSSAAAIPWIIQDQCPELDLSSQLFKSLFDYLSAIFRSLKHKFRCKGHVDNLINDYPEEMMKQETDPEWFHEWMKGRLDSNVFRFIYGPRTAAVIDYNNSFADKTQLPFFYFQQIFATFGAELCRLVKAEAALNPDTKWSSKLPGGSPEWVKDDTIRAHIRKSFDGICQAERFQHVELSSFKWVVWVTPQNIRQEESVNEEPPIRRKARFLQPFQFDDTPPPPSSNASSSQSLWSSTQVNTPRTDPPWNESESESGLVAPNRTGGGELEGNAAGTGEPIGEKRDEFIDPRLETLAIEEQLEDGLPESGGDLPRRDLAGDELDNATRGPATPNNAVRNPAAPKIDRVRRDVRSRGSTSPLGRDFKQPLRPQTDQAHRVKKRQARVDQTRTLRKRLFEHPTY